MALAITRKKGTSFWVGPIRVTIVDEDRGQCIVGIDAPKDFEILREEVIKDRCHVPGKFGFPVPRPQAAVEEAETTELVINGRQQG